MGEWPFCDLPHNNLETVAPVKFNDFPCSHLRMAFKGAVFLLYKHDFPIGLEELREFIGWKLSAIWGLKKALKH